MKKKILVLIVLIFLLFLGKYLWQQYDLQLRIAPLYDQLSIELSESDLLDNDLPQSYSTNDALWKTEVLDTLKVITQKVKSVVNQDDEWGRKQDWNSYWLDKNHPEPDLLWAIELVKWGDVLIQSLESDINPFDNMRGQSDHLRVFRVKSELIPYRVYLPKGYNSDKRYPVVIGFHSRDGTEDLFFHAFNGNDLRKVLDQKQFIFVGTTQGGLLGRCGEPHSKLVVHSLVEKISSRNDIDVNNISYLGHSRGSPAAIHCAIDKADTPRSIILMAPSFNVEKEFGEISVLRNIPIYIVTGGKDPSYRDNGKAMYDLLLANKFRNIAYKEVQGEDHFFTREADHGELFTSIFMFLKEHEANCESC